MMRYNYKANYDIYNTYIRYHTIAHYDLNLHLVLYEKNNLYQLGQVQLNGLLSEIFKQNNALNVLEPQSRIEVD